MPVYKCNNGKYRIGSGKCIYKTKQLVDKSYRGYLSRKQGWYGQGLRHSLASKGIKSKQDLKPYEQRELEWIVNELKHPAINEIALFGSRSKGHGKETSDYDIMVFVNPNKDLPDEYFERPVFKFVQYPFDIKFVEDFKTYGDLIWTEPADREEFDEMGVPLSSDIMKDMITLWRNE